MFLPKKLHPSNSYLFMWSICHRQLLLFSIFSAFKATTKTDNLLIATNLYYVAAHQATLSQVWKASKCLYGCCISYFFLINAVQRITADDKWLNISVYGSRVVKWDPKCTATQWQLLCCLFLPQFQLVADLFQDEKGAPVSAGKTSKINVRPAKPMPKSHNREHRKSVGTQVRRWEVAHRTGIYSDWLNKLGFSWEVKSLACLCFIIYS